MTSSKTYAAIWHALRARELLTFLYDGSVREVYAIILGYSADGGERLFAYQVGGQTKSAGKLPNWRCLKLDAIRGQMSSRKSGWREGASHKTTQSCIQFVDLDINIPDTLTHPKPLGFGSPLLRPPRGMQKA